MAAPAMLLLKVIAGVLALVPSVFAQVPLIPLPAMPSQVAAYHPGPSYPPSPSYTYASPPAPAPGPAPTYPPHPHVPYPSPSSAVTPVSDPPPPPVYPPAYTPTTYPELAPPLPPPITMYDVMASNVDQVGMFKNLVDGLRMQELFKQDQKTAFVPSDRALRGLLYELGLTADALGQVWSTYPSQAQALVKSHLVGTPVYFKGRLAFEERYSTAWGDVEHGRGIIVKRTPTGTADAWADSVESVSGSEARVLKSDIPAATSYVHIIDGVLSYWYPSIWQAVTHSYLASSLSSLQTAFVSAKMDSMLALPTLSYTLLAVNDNAFARTTRIIGINPSALGSQRDREALARYHLLTQSWDGESELATGSVATWESGVNLTYGNRTFTSYGNTRGFVGQVAVAVGFLKSRSWVVPVSGEVLLPINATTYDLMRNAPDLSLIVKLLDAQQNVTKYLKDATVPFTVFAPSNAAVQALAASYNTTTDKLFPEKLNATILNTILSLHVIQELALNGEAVKNATQAAILTGARISVVNSTVTVVGSQRVPAKIIAAGLNATYGRSYVHIIDSVLLPPVETPSVVTPDSSAAGMPAASLGLVTLMTGLALFLVRLP